MVQCRSLSNTELPTVALGRAIGYAERARSLLRESPVLYRAHLGSVDAATIATQVTQRCHRWRAASRPGTDENQREYLWNRDVLTVRVDELATFEMHDALSSAKKHHEDAAANEYS